MSDRLITKECIAFYVLTFAVQVCVRKKDVSFVVDVAICACKRKFLLWFMQQSLFIPVKCAIFIPVECSNEARATYPGFSGAVPDSFTKSNVLYE